MTHNVENDNDVEIENVMMNKYHHDHGNETSMKGARQDGQASVSPLCAECPAETDSAAENNDASEAPMRNCDPSYTHNAHPSLFTINDWALSDMPLPMVTIWTWHRVA